MNPIIKTGINHNLKTIILKNIMKKLNLLILMLTALFLFSCEKNDDITVSINECGSLELRIIDNEKRPVENAHITLMDVESESILIKDEVLGIEGIYKMDKILQGSYKCFISVERDGKEYVMTSYFQIFTKDNKVVEYNPFSNTGIINVSAKISGANDITQYSLAIVPYNGIITTSVDEVKENAFIIKNLNENGKLTISDIPADLSYVVYIYKDNIIYNSSTFSKTKKDQDIFVAFNVGTLNVNIGGEVADYNKYDVIVTPYMSSNVQINEIKRNTLFSGKSDSDGKITFKEVPYSTSYTVFLVKNDIIYNSYSFNINNQSSNVSLNVGSISVKVQGSITNPTSYSIALTQSSYSDLSSIKKVAFADGKLDANANIKFTELSLYNYQGSSYYIYLYKDNKIYNSDWNNWYSADESRTIYIYE